MNKQYFRNMVLVQKPYSVYKNISHCALEYLCYKRVLCTQPRNSLPVARCLDFPISACCPRGLQGREAGKVLETMAPIVRLPVFTGPECEMKCKSWVLTLEQWPSTPASGGSGARTQAAG